jgi:hypothetical protein
MSYKTCTEQAECTIHILLPPENLDLPFGSVRGMHGRMGSYAAVGKKGICPT